MKKITLLFLVCLTFAWQGFAQTLNQNASWPNVSWTVTGTYNTDPSAFEADPTITSNFAFDDDDAGNGSDDDIAAESPIIDLTAAFGAGETWLTVSADYVYNWNTDDELLFQYWDADSAMWVDWGVPFDADTSGAPTDNFCSGTSETYTSDVLNIAGFTATQLSGFRYRIYFDDLVGGAGYEWGFCFSSPTIVSATPPSCIDPSMLNASAITDTTAELGWMENGTASAWNIELGATGFTPTGTATNAGVSNPYSAMSLTAETTYDYYVQADCGVDGTSNWIGPFTFTTACAALAAPYSEDFESFTTGGSAFTLENCWSGTGGAYYWESAPGTDTGSGGTGPSPTITTGNYFYTEASGGTSGDITELLSPLVDLTALTAPALTFNYHMYGGQIGTLDVVVNGISTEWTLSGEQQTSDTEPWGFAVVDLAAYAGQSITITFRATSAGTFEGDMAIDNVSFTELPSCLPPSGLMASPTSTTEADITWTAGATETEWTYEYGVSPYTQGGGGTSGMVMTTPSLSLTGLTPGETYDIYVQSNCGGSDSSYITVQWSQPNLGDTCDAPIVVASLPYNSSDDTANYGDDYAGGPGTGCGSTSNYLNGDDVVYSYTATSDTSINVSLTSLSDNYAGVFAYNSCADIGTQCAVEGDVNGFSTADLAFDMAVTNGNTYYIVISTWASPQSTSYTLDITENTCTEATVTYTVVEDCAGSGGFNVEVDITDMGSATDITVSDDQGSADQTTMSATTLTFGPYVNGTDVVITVADDNDASCTLMSGALTQEACPPANDDCDNAVALTVNLDYDNTNTTAGTTVGATASSQADDVSGTPNTDVWFSFTAVYSAHRVELLNVVNQGGGTSTSTDMGMGVYDLTGGCGALAFVATSDPNTLNLTGLTPGTTYAVRVYGWFSSIQYNNFDISVGSDPALSIDDATLSAFTYYPNPVKNTLTLNAQNTIENVTMYNMLGQEVLRANPNSVDSDIDMSSLANGSYFVKVTIANVTKTIRVIKQ